MKHSRITFRLVITIIIFGFVLCSSIVGIGYTLFSNTFKKFYHNMMESISATALAVVDPDRTEYYKFAEADDYYNEVNKILNDITEKFDLNFIYVSMVSGENYSNIHYIYDTVKPGSAWKPYPRGYTETYIEETYNKSAKKIYETGESVVRHTLKSNSGSHIASMVPIKNAGGKVVAVLGVEKDIQEYTDTLHKFLINSSMAAFLITTLLVFLMSYFTRKKLIKPVLTISEEALRFKGEQTVNEGWNNSIHNNDEITDLAKDIADMEKNIVESVDNLTKVTAEKERISTELNVATQIQKSMLPCIFPPFPDRKEFDVYATMEPAKEVGGDFYDFFMVDEKHVAVVVADVSGKGVPAALFMVIGKTLIKDHTTPGVLPNQIFEEVNNLLCQSNSENLFITAFEGILNLETGEFIYVNAGHEMPYICKKNGIYELNKFKGGFVLAGMENMKYKINTVMLEPGDRLFQYTDGVTEAINSKNEEFGQDRVTESLNSHLEKNEEELLKAVRTDIDTFCKGVPQFDDITMLYLRYNGNVK